MRNIARIGAVIASASLLAASTVGAAQADRPDKTPVGPLTSPVTVNDLCSFPVTVTGQLEGFLIDSLDESDTGTQFYHLTETDTFSANGNTLQGEPYTFNIHITLEKGVASRDVGTGVGVRVPLPNGSTFFSAGQIDFSDSPDVDFIAIPTHGGSRNLDALCAALAE
jgi:hypothetical protein